MTRPGPFERFLTDAHTDALAVAQARQQAAMDALVGDIFDLGAGCQTGFDRLAAMRQHLMGDGE